MIYLVELVVLSYLIEVDVEQFRPIKNSGERLEAWALESMNIRLWEIVIVGSLNVGFGRRLLPLQFLRS